MGEDLRVHNGTSAFTSSAGLCPHPELTGRDRAWSARKVRLRAAVFLPGLLIDEARIVPSP